MYGKFTNSIAGIIISGAAIMAASCSGGAGMDTANPGNTEVDQAAIIEQAITTDEMPSSRTRAAISSIFSDPMNVPGWGLGRR